MFEDLISVYLVSVFSQASLQYDSYNDGYFYHICGGTIIDAFHIMTAAHCILRLGHSLVLTGISIHLYICTMSILSTSQSQILSILFCAYSLSVG